MFPRLTLALLVGLLPAQQDDPIAPFRAAVTAAEQQHGADSAEVADALVRLSQALGSRGRSAEGLETARRALVIREAKFPAGHTRIGTALANVGSSLIAVEDLDAAETHLQKALAIYQPRGPSRALLGILSNLGIAAHKRGDYRLAVERFDASLQIARQLPEEHVFLGLALQNLAQTKVSLGEIEASRALVEEALGVFERQDKDGLRRAQAIAGLGYVLLAADRPREAEPLLRRGITAFESLPGPRPDAYWMALLNHGLALALADRPADAAAVAERALTEAERSGSPASLGLARLGAAKVHLAAGVYDLAHDLLAKQRAHPDAQGLPEVARWSLEATFGTCCLRRGDFATAATVLAPVVAATDGPAHRWTSFRFRARSDLAQALFRRGEPAAAVPHLLANLREFGGRLDRVLPALLEKERLEHVAAWRRDLFLLLECNRLAPAACDVGTAYAALLTWKGQVARGQQRQLQAARADAEGTARLRRLQELAGLAAMGRATATELAEQERLGTLLGRELPAATDAAIDVAALQNGLPEGRALLDFVSTEDRDGVTRFVAFVVHRDAIRRIDLGPAAAITQALDPYLRVTSRALQRGAEAVRQPLGQTLRDLVFTPLAAALDGRRDLLVCPDGALATLPFETLPEGQGYLLETHTVSYLQDAREALRLPPATTGTQRVVAFGGIDYGSSEPAVASLRGVPRPFAALPQTEAELAAITRFAGEACQLWRGGAAGERQLREAAPGATLLHLATHGFCGDQDRHDGVHCSAGVALAMANRCNGDDDGILTVDEAELLDLRSCRLAVLSACETGLGQPFAGENLLGLRRGLRIAGAAATLTSLWRVDDSATAELMADFYGNLLQQGQAPLAAFRQAQLQALARARTAAGEGLPGRWGGFVFEGVR